MTLTKSFSFLFGLSFLIASCGQSPKTLSGVQTGMSKEEVIAIVGEPKNKNVVNKTEIWDYPESDRTVVFRMDTVYTILTSAEARADSVGMWLDKTNDKVKDQLGNFVDKADSAGDRITDKLRDKLRKDTTDKEKK